MLRSKSQGLVAGIFLLSTYFFLRVGASQYADVPIGFFMLAAMVALSFGDTDPERSPMAYALAGITVGLAAWTKNEGALFVMAVIAARIVSAFLVRRQGRHGWLREAAFFLAGLAPILAVLVFFKLTYAPPNDLIGENQTGLALAKIVDVGRYAIIAKAFLSTFARWGIGLLPILLVYVFLAGIRHDTRNSRIVATGCALLAFMLCGYFMVYVLTPHDLAWHLGSSLERLLLQIWPTFLFVLFMIVAPIEGKGKGEKWKVNGRGK
jgi:4-amino-4-deoxy-L-arabinose transferase-like glycosyltransferase